MPHMCKTAQATQTCMCSRKRCLVSGALPAVPGGQGEDAMERVHQCQLLVDVVLGRVGTGYYWGDSTGRAGSGDY